MFFGNVLLLKSIKEYLKLNIEILENLYEILLN